MQSYRIHKVLDAAQHLSACPPSQWQYPSSLRGLRGKTVSCLQTLRPFFMSGSTRTDEISFRWRTTTNCNELNVDKSWIMYDGAKHQTHILDCSEVITGGFSWGTDFAIIGQPDFVNPPDFRIHQFASFQCWLQLVVFHLKGDFLSYFVFILIILSLSLWVLYYIEKLWYAHFWTSLGCSS